MKLRLAIVVACVLLAVSGCVIAPYGDDGGRGYYGHHDDGHRVWR